MKYFNKVIELIEGRTVDSLYSEWIWFITNVIESSNEETKIDLIKDEIISKIIRLMKEWINNVKLVKLLLISVGKLLEISKYYPETSTTNPKYVFEIEGGIDLLESFQGSPNVAVFATSQNLLKRFYPGGEETDMMQFTSSFQS